MILSWYASLFDYHLAHIFIALKIGLYFPYCHHTFSLVILVYGKKLLDQLGKI